MTDLFFELFTGLPRQGPGDEASTLRALRLVPPLGPEGRILDVGCGTGTQSLVLARHAAARIVAIDNHAPFVEELSRSVRGLGLAPRLEACVASMAALPFAPGSFDLARPRPATVLVASPRAHPAPSRASWRPPLPEGRS